MKKLKILGLFALTFTLALPSAGAIGIGKIKGTAKNVKDGAQDAKDLADASLSTEEEIAYGKGMHPYILAEMGGAYKNRALQGYVDSVGQKLAAGAKRKDLKFNFTVVNNPMVNAFAMPGGYIYVTTGILKTMKDEAELAAVLGHEIGHVDARHSVKRLQSMVMAEKGSKYANKAVGKVAKKGMGKVGGALTKQAFKKLSGEFAQIALMGYGRNQELESDRIGIQLANDNRYDPEGAVRLFETLLSLEGGSASHGNSLFSSHPETKKRIKKAQKEIKKLKNKGSETNQAKYLAIQSKF